MKDLQDRLKVTNCIQSDNAVCHPEERSEEGSLSGLPEIQSQVSHLVRGRVLGSGDVGIGDFS